MSASALILTYHAVGPGPAPLFVDRALLAAQLDCIAESGRRVLTVAALADALRAGVLPARAAAITFDDGFASVAEAAPLLAERGFPATVFCVADRVGGRSDWPSQPLWAPRLPLLGAAELRELVGAGWEVGSHGLSHMSLGRRPSAEVERELTESKLVLEDALESGVHSFAYPYGVVPQSGRAALSEAGYSAACTIRAALVDPTAHPLELPRVDAHYLRRLSFLRSALAGRPGLYLGVRRVAARARRLVSPDHIDDESAS